jgi:hypothetical protein
MEVSLFWLLMILIGLAGLGWRVFLLAGWLDRKEQERIDSEHRQKARQLRQRGEKPNRLSRTESGASTKPDADP